jgi:hypothetical protein
MRRRPSPGEPARVYVHDSLIAGDVDFIFGNATLVIDVQHDPQPRRPPHARPTAAMCWRPAHRRACGWAFLVTRSRFLAEPGTPLANISLGRAWDEGVARGTWQPGVSPNGQALVRDSLLGPHLALAGAVGGVDLAPALHGQRRAGRPPGRVQQHRARRATRVAREVLSPWNGWAAAGGGVTGGAAALPGDVHRVRTRAELAAALRPHPTAAHRAGAGLIDLAREQADDGRRAGEADFRDPALDWAAFERAYDPATWGRDPPRARRRTRASVPPAPGGARGAACAVAHHAHRHRAGRRHHRRHAAAGRTCRTSSCATCTWPTPTTTSPPGTPRTTATASGTRSTTTCRCATRAGCGWTTARFDDGAAPRPRRAGAPGPSACRSTTACWTSRGSPTWSPCRGTTSATTTRPASWAAATAATADEGRLRVTYHHNHWDGVKERAPRVRYGRVHLYNNLYTVADRGCDTATASAWACSSRIVAQNNVWVTPPGLPAGRLLRWWGGSALAGQRLAAQRPAGGPAGHAARGQPRRPLRCDVGWQPCAGGADSTAATVATACASAPARGAQATGR